MVAITSYEFFSNWNHARSWENADAVVDSVRAVCRFEKREFFQNHSKFNDVYCDDSESIAQKVKGGWSEIRYRLVEIKLEYGDRSGRKIYAEFMPWQSEAGSLAKGQKIEIQYSPTPTSNVDFAGSPAKNASDGLKALIFALCFTVVFLVGWMATRNRDDSPPSDTKQS